MKSHKPQTASIFNQVVQPWDLLLWVSEDSAKSQTELFQATREVQGVVQFSYSELPDQENVPRGPVGHQCAGHNDPHLSISVPCIIRLELKGKQYAYQSNINPPCLAPTRIVATRRRLSNSALFGRRPGPSQQRLCWVSCSSLG